MKSIYRTIAATVSGLAVVFLTAGVANAAPAATGEEGVPIWLLPGVDLGPVADIAIQLPAQLLRPVFGLL